jgi:hypothetical protein
MATADRKMVRVEVTEETLTRLLAAGQVCATDFCCLDCKSKRCLWRLCLKSCTIRVSTAMGSQSTPQGFCRTCGLCLQDIGQKKA